MKLIYKMIGKPVEEAILPIIELLENPPKPALSAFIQRKEVACDENFLIKKMLKSFLIKLVNY